MRRCIACDRAWPGLSPRLLPRPGLPRVEHSSLRRAPLCLYCRVEDSRADSRSTGRVAASFSFLLLFSFSFCFFASSASAPVPDPALSCPVLPCPALPCSALAHRPSPPQGPHYALSVSRPPPINRTPVASPDRRHVSPHWPPACTQP